MQLQECYKYQPKDFDDSGFHHITEQWFMDLITEFEKDFHEKHPHCYANYLFSDNSTMMLINKAMDLEPNESSGMDLIDGEIDMEANFEIESYSNIRTVYAIGSKLEMNEDEPIFLVISEEISNGLILLKYIPDNESEDPENELPLSEDDIVTENNRERIIGG